jgi:hypothetical protein
MVDHKIQVNWNRIIGCNTIALASTVTSYALVKQARNDNSIIVCNVLTVGSLLLSNWFRNKLPSLYKEKTIIKATAEYQTGYNNGYLIDNEKHRNDWMDFGYTNGYSDRSNEINNVETIIKCTELQSVWPNLDINSRMIGSIDYDQNPIKQSVY